MNPSIDRRAALALLAATAAMASAPAARVDQARLMRIRREMTA